MRSALPSATDTLLLQATFLPGPRAVEAWHAWREAVDFENLDHSSRHLLPLLFDNLTQLGIDSPLLGRCEGIKKRNWYQNQLLMPHLEAILGAFQHSDLPVLLIHGAALNALNLFGAGQRSMVDLDLVVPIARGIEAAEILNRAGWKPERGDRLPFTLDDLRFTLRGSFNKNPALRLTLHWGTPARFRRGPAAEAAWSRSVIASWQEQPVRVLHPVDHLLLACAHEVDGGGGARPWPWVGDALALIRSHPIDWTDFVAQARRHQLTYVVRDRLRFLAETLSAPIPSATLEQLDTVRIGSVDQWLWNSTFPPDGEVGLLGAVGRHILRLRHLTGNRPGPMAILGYLVYTARLPRRGPPIRGLAKNLIRRIRISLGGPDPLR